VLWSIMEWYGVSCSVVECCVVVKCCGVLWSVVCVVKCCEVSWIVVLWVWSAVECYGVLVLWSFVEFCGVLWSVVECCGVLWIMQCCEVL